MLARGPIYLFLLFLQGNAHAASETSLPALLNATALPAIFIDENTKVRIRGEISFPAGTKLTPTGPSRLSLYEKIHSTFVSLPNRSLRGAPKAGGGLRFDEGFTLSDPKAELVYDLVIYYCSNGEGGACSLHSYRGVVSRTPGRRLGKSIDLKINLPPIGKTKTE
jgi:hypothetical protein